MVSHSRILAFLFEKKNTAVCLKIGCDHWFSLSRRSLLLSYFSACYRNYKDANHSLHLPKFWEKVVWLLPNANSREQGLLFPITSGCRSSTVKIAWLHGDQNRNILNFLLCRFSLRFSTFLKDAFNKALFIFLTFPFSHFPFLQL